MSFFGAFGMGVGFALRKGLAGVHWVFTSKIHSYFTENKCVYGQKTSEISKSGNSVTKLLTLITCLYMGIQEDAVNSSVNSKSINPCNTGVNTVNTL